MGLGEFFDGVVREVGRMDAVKSARDEEPALNGLFRGSESRCKKRFLAQQRESNSSSNNSGGGVGTLLLGAAIFGAMAFLGSSGDKNTNTTAK